MAERTDWAYRTGKSVLYLFFGRESVDSWLAWESDKAAVTRSLEHVVLDLGLGKLIESIDFLLGKFTGPAVRLSAAVLHRITGVNVNVEDYASATPSRDQSVGIGKEFSKLVEQVFSPFAATSDHVSRIIEDGGFANLDAFFGTNLLFQLRSLSIGTIAAFFPRSELRNLEGLHQSVNWAFGFGWLSWAIMSEYMNITTMPAVRRRLNRQVKPNDYSEGEAYSARLAGQITPGVFNQVLDNYGVRTDIRTVLLAIKEPDLTETDLRTASEWGRLDPDAIAGQLQLRGYQEQRRALKLENIVQDRRRALMERRLKARAQLYRDCVITEGEVRNTALSMGYDLDEVDLFLENTILERAQRRFLTQAQMKKALADKEISTNEVLADLSCQGFTTRDAGIILQELLGTKAKLPKITQFSVTPGVVAPGGGIVIQWTTTNADHVTLHIEPKTGAPSDLTLQAQGSLNQVISQDTIYRLSVSNKVGEISKADSVQVRFARPTASLSVSPGVITIGLLPTEVEVKWSTANATKVTITPGIGVVPPDGARIVSLNTDITFTLIAEGPGGTETAQDTVIAKPAAIALPHIVVGPPKVTLNVSPGVIEQGQDVALQWSIQDADEATLYPLNEKVTGTGAKLLQVNAETIFTIIAKNAFGTTTKTDAVTFKGAASTPGDTGPAAPWGYFYANRSEVKAGDRVVLTWNVSDADTVTITPGVGTVEKVGTKIVVVSVDTIFEIKAVGPGGEWKYQQAVLVSA